jgi:hypothetical protein
MLHHEADAVGRAVPDADVSGYERDDEWVCLTLNLWPVSTV